MSAPRRSATRRRTAPRPVAVVLPPEPTPEPEPMPSPEWRDIPDGPLTDDEWEYLTVAYRDSDLPLHPDEQLTGQRVDDDGDLFITTSFGRKVGISPDGWMTVTTGPDLDVAVQAVPKPPRKSWKDPR